MPYDTDLTNDFIFRHIIGDERNNDLLKYFVNTEYAFIAQYQYEVGEERYNKGRMEGLAKGEEKAKQKLARTMKDLRLRSGRYRETHSPFDSGTRNPVRFRPCKVVLRGGSENPHLNQLGPFCLHPQPLTPGNRNHGSP